MITSNNELEISIPEDFHEMSAEEMAGLQLIAGGEGICLKAPELHIIVSIGWKKTNFLSKILNGDDLVKNMDSSYMKAMQQFGYRRTDDLSREVGGIRAGGLRYEYEVQGVGMTGESFVLRKENEIYYFHVYYRTNLSGGSRDVWNGILDSAKWK